jgi:acyl-CoA synthetase (AMP-forming)/AMP-acid ligase II
MTFVRSRLTVDRVLTRSAAQWDQKDAIVAPDVTLSYVALETSSRRFARVLLARGVGVGSRIGVILPSSADLVISLFAIARTGATLVPINPGFTDPELTHILKDAAVSVLICRKSHTDRAHALRAAVPSLREVIEIDSFSQLMALIEGMSAAPLNAPVFSDATHSILYTSGTTGRPKGAMLSHRSRVFNSLPCVIGYEIGPATRMHCPVPLFHSGGMVIGIMSGITAGATVIVGYDAGPDTTAHLMARHGANCLLSVPTIIRRLLDSAAFNEIAAGRSFSLIHGGAGMPSALAQRMFETWPGCRPIHAYGATEAPQLTALSPEEYRSHLSATGRPLPGLAVEVCDASGNAVPPGTLGEIVTSGPHLFDGYLNDAEGTAKVLRDGQFWTGDLATVDEAGIITISGRSADLIISGGFNVYAREVEEALYTHPQVQHAAVFGLPDEEWGETVAAAIILRPEATLTEDEVIRFCRTRLASYKKPKRVWFVDELPLTPVGKVQKFKLAERFAARPADGGER